MMRVIIKCYRTDIDDNSYTTDGNYDLVGNNLPVFFIRDGLKFPDMVHAFKPNPVSVTLPLHCTG